MLRQDLGAQSCSCGGVSGGALVAASENEAYAFVLYRDWEGAELYSHMS